MQHEHAAGRVVLGPALFRGELLAELLRQFLVLVLGGGELPQQVTHRFVRGALRRAPIEARGLVFHLLGELARGVDGERAVEPDRPPRHEALDVLAADQRQKVAEFLAMQFEQHVAMPDLFFRHFVVHFGGVRIGGTQRAGEGAINAVILVLVGDCERENFLLVQVGETFHGDPLGRRLRRRAAADAKWGYVSRFLY